LASASAYADRRAWPPVPFAQTEGLREPRQTRHARANRGIELTTSSKSSSLRSAAVGAGSRIAFWWPLGLSFGLGAFAGIGGFTFRYAEGLSYFSADPAACVNCHIMQAEYDGWQKGSHHAVAVCVDCHLPHDFIPKYLAKAENGWRHGEKFTTQSFREPIFVQPAGLRILQDNCVRCHQALVPMLGDHEQSVAAGAHARNASGRSDTPQCVHCHATVGHGERAGLGGPLRTAELRQLLDSPMTARQTDSP
jgi:cytochrome c nitrite reductase small subunit